MMNRENIDKLITYGLYDCEGLYKLFNVTSEIIDITGKMELWNLPLSYVLYETEKSNTEVILSRLSIENNICPAYIKLVDESVIEGGYKGAHTFTETVYKA